MKSNDIIAIGVAIIAIGVVVQGITWISDEIDRENYYKAYDECEKTESYQLEMMRYREFSQPYLLENAQDLLRECMDEKGWRLRF